MQNNIQIYRTVSGTNLVPETEPSGRVGEERKLLLLFSLFQQNLMYFNFLGFNFLELQFRVIYLTVVLNMEKLLK